LPDKAYWITAHHVAVTLNKSFPSPEDDDDSLWPRLVKSSSKNHRVRVDWDSWLPPKEDEKVDEDTNTLDESKLGEQLKFDPNDKFGAWNDPLGPSTRSMYLLTYNGIMLLGWAWVFINLLTLLITPAPADTVVHPNDVPSFLPPNIASRIVHAHERVGRVVFALQALAMLELMHAITGLVPGTPLGSFLLHGGRNIVLFGAIYQWPLLTTHWGVFLTYFVWAIGECVRYPHYLLTLIPETAALSSFITSCLVYARYTAPLILLPFGFLGECAVLRQLTTLYDDGATIGKGLLSYMPASIQEGLVDALPPADGIIYAYMAFAYTMGAPFLYMTMWNARKRKLGPVGGRKGKKAAKKTQ
jgi:very-long-chain (3R)-3-hydroxyacyl-CoA dehydratase